MGELRGRRCEEREDEGVALTERRGRFRLGSTLRSSAASLASSELLENLLIEYGLVTPIYTN
jgi:hypothetical protein